MSYFISPRLFFETAELNTHYLGWLLLGDFYKNKTLVFKNNVFDTKTITKDQTIGAYSNTKQNILRLVYKHINYKNEGIGLTNTEVINEMLLVNSEQYKIEEMENTLFAIKTNSVDGNGESSTSIGDAYIEISNEISDFKSKILGKDDYYISSNNTFLTLVDYGKEPPNFEKLIENNITANKWYIGDSTKFLQNFKDFKVLYSYKIEDINKKINNTNFYNLAVGNIKVKFNNLEVN